MTDISYDFGSQQAMPENLILKAAEIGIKNEVLYISRYTRGDTALVKDETFKPIWDNFPSLREAMLQICIATINANSYYSTAISRSLAQSIVDDLYDSVCDKRDYQSSRIKNIIVGSGIKKVDFLEEATQYSIDPDDSRQLQMWLNTGTLLSNDPSFFRYLWDKVERSPGSSDKKVEIINAATKNSALPLSIIKECAKSSTKNVKRTIVRFLAAKAESIKSSIRYGYAVDVDAEKKILSDIDELGMLFVVGNDDYEMIQNLIGVLSKNNLPWLLPAAAKNKWLSERIQQVIDEKEW